MLDGGELWSDMEGWKTSRPSVPTTAHSITGLVSTRITCAVLCYTVPVQPTAPTTDI